MAVCASCHKQISAPDSKKQHVQKNDAGRVTGVLHHKCWYRQKRTNWTGSESRKYYSDSPTAYEMDALRTRQAELAADKEKEEAPKAFNDWRDPDTAEF